MTLVGDRWEIWDQEIAQPEASLLSVDVDCPGFTAYMTNTYLKATPHGLNLLHSGSSSPSAVLPQHGQVFLERRASEEASRGGNGGNDSSGPAAGAWQRL